MAEEKGDTLLVEIEVGSTPEGKYLPLEEQILFPFKSGPYSTGRQNIADLQDFYYR